MHWSERGQALWIRNVVIQPTRLRNRQPRTGRLLARYAASTFLTARISAGPTGRTSAMSSVTSACVWPEPVTNSISPFGHRPRQPLRHRLVSAYASVILVSTTVSRTLVVICQSSGYAVMNRGNSSPCITIHAVIIAVERLFGPVIEARISYFLAMFCVFRWTGQYSIRINGQWRICFEWPQGAAGPSNVEIVDYH